MSGFDAGTVVREGGAASRLQSDYVVRIMGVDTLEDGAPHLVMEQLEGADLSGVRRSKQLLAPTRPSTTCSRPPRPSSRRKG